MYVLTKGPFIPPKKAVKSHLTILIFLGLHLLVFRISLKLSFTKCRSNPLFQRENTPFKLQKNTKSLPNSDLWRGHQFTIPSSN